MPRYGLLGACWLVRKCDGEIRDAAHRLIVVLAVGVLVFLELVFVYALSEHLPILQRWIDLPYLFVFPVIGAVAAIVLALSTLSQNDRWPFYMVALIFVAAFGTLALSFWPYMIPLRHHHRRSGRAAVQSDVYVLGWRRRLPADAALHGHQLQASSGARSEQQPSTIETAKEAHPWAERREA